MNDPQFSGLSTQAMCAEMRVRLAHAFLPCVAAAREQRVQSLDFGEAALNALGQMMGEVISSFPIAARNMVLSKCLEAMPEWIASAEEWRPGA